MLDQEGIYVLPIPCGKCLACLINKRRQWSLRILLERSMHEKACFISLTYAPENMPVSDESGKVGRGVLCLPDLQKFLKRLRKHFSDREIRYYACGEYGPNGNHMPHYHLILFGVDAEELDRDWFYYLGRSGPIAKNRIRDSLLYQLWNRYGTVHVGDASQHSITYVAGYVTHKITKEDDGFTPEFHTMSRMPGLGLEALVHLTRYLQEVSERGHNPGAARQIHLEGHLWPTGRYLLSKLRRISDVSTSDSEYIASFVSAFRAAKQQNTDLLTYLCQQDDQKFLNLESRQKLFKQRNKI